MKKNEDIPKCKGIKKNGLKKKITFDDYEKCLFSGEERMRKMNIPKSKNRDIYSMTMNKIALSANDDKRIIMEDKIHTKVLR